MSETNEKKDIVEKEFVAFPDVAADVINVLLYQGERVADKDSLMAGPTESVYQGKRSCGTSMRISVNTNFRTAQSI